MTITVSTLSNGLRVITDRMDHVETASLGVWVGAGTRHESASMNGVSHLLTVCLSVEPVSKSADDLWEPMFSGLTEASHGGF